ncbi:class I adenylate-forming enzyme family protein [Phenylobacterium sp.]|uniref:class I adenylate-forming enzyme family protein n=1 Tax=Phenylobacterium sp. TaxID=1871053 RepID=UPI00301DBDED
MTSSRPDGGREVAGDDGAAPREGAPVFENPLAMFEWRVRHDPDAPFLVSVDGAAQSYAELAGRAAALADVLEARGVGRGDVVGVYLGNDRAWVVAMLACWRLGATAACCADMLPPVEAAGRFELSGATHVIARGWPEAGERTIIVDAEGAAEGAPLPRPGDIPEPRAHLLTPESPAVVLFTSGSTGQAKPVWRPHSALAEGSRMTAGAYAKVAGFRPRTAPPTSPPAINFSPFGHSAALGRVLFRIYVGRRLILIPKFTVDAIEQLAKNYEVDTLQLAPAMIHDLAYTDRDIRFRNLKYVNSGTAPLPISTRDKFEARYGAPVLQAYGSTEGAVMSLERYEDVIAGRRGPGSVGRIASGTPHRIVDPQGKDVAPGETGELVGRMPSAEGAEPHPGVDAEGWFHTGDLARIDEHGILYICGRIKEMMIVGGFNVYPGEVEEALRTAPEVRDAVVVPMPDPRLGEVPVAGVVWADDLAGPAAEEAWRRVAAAVRGLLEPYKTPRRWFTLAAIPLNPNGKVDRKEALGLATEALRDLAET